MMVGRSAAVAVSLMMNESPGPILGEQFESSQIGCRQSPCRFARLAPAHFSLALYSGVPMYSWEVEGSGRGSSQLRTRLGLRAYPLPCRLPEYRAREEPPQHVHMRLLFGGPTPPAPASRIAGSASFAPPG